MVYLLNKTFIILGFLILANQVAGQDENKYIVVPKGEYEVGKVGSKQNPIHFVSINSFQISIYEITNKQFERFVIATGYKTDAEKHHNAMVFFPGLGEFKWRRDSTAYWKYPNGIKRGNIKKKMDHPVTCISYTDALAYCKWANVRLPTLAEWEIACRAGSKTDYFFGKEDNLIGVYANIWNGRNHMKADYSDGYMYTSPVGKFKPNAWGLYDVYGNVFEFCSGHLPFDKRDVVHARGGSWWCSKNTCHSFNSYSIGQVNIHASFSNQGFRVVKS